MSEHTAVPAMQPFSIGEYMRQGSHRLAAQQMMRHLGSMAAACALDRQALAHHTANTQESGFWAHVCREIIALQTVAPAAGPMLAH